MHSPSTSGKFVPLPDDLIKDLRENARTFIKLDIAYIVAAGAVVTAFKLGPNDVLKIAGFYWAVVVSLLITFLHDVWIESVLLGELISARTNSPSRLSGRWVRWQSNFQLGLHVIFVCGVAFLGLKVADARYTFDQEMSARVRIQERVNIFISVHKRVPQSIEELRAANPGISEDLDQLGNEPVKIEALQKSRTEEEIRQIQAIDYLITFAGRDKAIGTSDDVWVNRQFSVQRLKDTIDRDRNGERHKIDDRSK